MGIVLMRPWLFPCLLAVLAIVLGFAVQPRHKQEEMQGLKNVVVVGGSYVGSVSPGVCGTIQRSYWSIVCREQPQSLPVRFLLDTA